MAVIWPMMALVGCLERDLKPLNPCLVSGVVESLAVRNVDKVDLLFVVDDSSSMAAEQQLLREQFPNMINTLTSGVRSDGTSFPPAKDLHLAVVSTDMGVPGIPTPPMGCGSATGGSEFGRDGVMNNAPDSQLPDCGNSPLPKRFLEYRMGADDATKTAETFGCIASLGTAGCGFEQQLEAGLKALWPSIDIDPQTGEQWVDKETGMPSNRILFVGNAQGEGQLGHGDGVNAGFLRQPSVDGLSVLAVVVVTDEEDCSSVNPQHFIPDMNLVPEAPYKGQPVNLRCHLNPQNLYRTSRYVEGFRALRPNNEDLVIFAAIAGVPQDLVTQAELEKHDFEDDASRDAFYAKIEGDPRMQATINDKGDNLVHSCEGTDAESGAYPPRRIVEVAKGFGKNGLVQSICQPDFSPAVNAITDLIIDKIPNVCLPKPLVRDSDGEVSCNVIWELPLASNTLVPIDAPRECQDLPYLSLPDEGAALRTEDGRARCVVDQLAVVEDVVAAGEGWYYDDFSEKTRIDCPNEPRQRIAYSSGAVPVTGINIELDCLSEVQTVAIELDDVEVDPTQGELPKIGFPCEDGGDAACEIRLRGGQMDTRLFCHRELNVCSLGCTANADCPAAWVCDTRTETQVSAGGMDAPRSICVNPTCGGGQ